jgi:hypothetical protein
MTSQPATPRDYLGTTTGWPLGTIVVCGGGCVASLPVMAARPNREAPPLAATAATSAWLTIADAEAVTQFPGRRSPRKANRLGTVPRPSQVGH